ncbi:MAG: histidine kinase [Microbacteriaceae bacterium]|nr:histidine kinase [Microbacteriaceae bacterium]
MELITKERDRLLHRSTRAIGLGATAVAFVCLCVPGVLPWPSVLSTLPFLVVLAFCLYRVGSSQWLGWILLGLVAGLGLLLDLRMRLNGSNADAVSAALVPLGGGAIASFSILLTSNFRRIALLAVSFIATIALIEFAAPGRQIDAERDAAITLGWILATVFGYWLSASVPRAARRIHSIGRAHRAERQASEIEAQRRQGARLLHDTVLATLTLLAHSGVGVAASALQQQAGEDARLLRQLRLGASPVPHSSGVYNLEPVEESPLGTTLESVKQRFGRMGLEVSWHGTGQVLLPSDVLDAFLLALAECLENVRRHSGVTDAHVTITDDESTVRAMVTDAGVGFDLKDIDEARLGFKDSVVARLKDVGGNARLFSSPGAGTTVVLEVPK